MDPRLTPATERVAHISLKGKVNAPKFVEASVQTVRSRVTDLYDKPRGARQCQLLFGESFHVLEELEYDAFGFRESDGYVGWVPKMCLGQPTSSPSRVTEMKVAVQRAAFLREPDIKSAAQHETPLSFGSIVHHRQYSDQKKEADLQADGWLCCLVPTNHIPQAHFIRKNHVIPKGEHVDDPAGIAELFLHTPYLWGGDSSFGIDCSGLVQRALQACGTPCPRDSDMQFGAFTEIESSDLQRGDLVFWKGHVGMMLDQHRLIHANAHHMAVAVEPLDQAIKRIASKEFGDVIGYARP